MSETASLADRLEAKIEKRQRSLYPTGLSLDRLELVARMACDHRRTVRKVADFIEVTEESKYISRTDVLRKLRELLEKCCEDVE